MALIIKVPDKGWSSQKITLSGRTYTLELYYGLFWSLSLKSGDESITYLSGSKIVPNKDFCIQHNLDNLLNGYLFVDSLDDSIPVERHNFGNGKVHRLMFLSKDNLDELQV